jgi:hypothetical protein
MPHTGFGALKKYLTYDATCAEVRVKYTVFTLLLFKYKADLKKNKICYGTARQNCLLFF